MVKTLQANDGYAGLHHLPMNELVSPAAKSHRYRMPFLGVFRLRTRQGGIDPPLSLLGFSVIQQIMIPLLYNVKLFLPAPRQLLQLNGGKHDG
jgi:hypothetical protein